ncbi:MAG: argininosuccinate lyase [Endomicrobium sp.]|jgi:argininosuccinate lyase|nr:argininosuccinate lyase [Endomicrobium sp.]
MNKLNFEQFIGSFSFDGRLAEADIMGSIAHVQMLVKTKIIKSSEGKRIISGLQSILRDLQKGRQLPKEEDIHFAVEKELIRRIGLVGGKMHTARSRNDQAAADLRIYLRKETDSCINLIEEFQRIIVKKAQENIDVLMPGFTHLQPAQPISAAHHLMAYAYMVQRDKERFYDCRKRINISPLGSAALAGTSFKIDRHFTAKLLGFGGVCENSLDGVSDRDFAVEFVFCVSMLAVHLTRFCEEIILWMNPEFAYIKIADKFTSGSSIMPQKRNPDCAEVIRGKSGRIFGALMALLTIIKALPLTYNRDLQEDKPSVFDVCDNIKMCMKVACEMVSGMKFVKENTLKSMEKGFIAATEIADYLARRGVPFREAHGVVKEIVSYCIKNSKTLNELTLHEYNKFYPKRYPAFKMDIYKYIDFKNIVEMKTSYGATSRKSVERQIKSMKNLLKKEK